MKQQVTEVEQKVITNNNLLFYLGDPDNDLFNLKHLLGQTSNLGRFELIILIRLAIDVLPDEAKWT